MKRYHVFHAGNDCCPYYVSSHDDINEVRKDSYQMVLCIDHMVTYEWSHSDNKWVICGELE